MEEVEVFGVNYERYALGELLPRLSREYEIRSVLELPAHGAKAMPSLYSLGFGLAGCAVTLANAHPPGVEAWKQLGLEDQLSLASVPHLDRTGLASESYDLVWNFAFITGYADPAALLNEMVRLSKRYIAFFSVNDHNVGFPIHRGLHRLHSIEWSHGNVAFNSMRQLSDFCRKRGLEVTEVGTVDCPPWPDSLGFRDLRLHKLGSNVKMSDVTWRSPYVEWVRAGEFPRWVKVLYAIEKVPSPLPLKLLYSHIFYVLCEKQSEPER